MLKQETQLAFWKYREELSQTDRIRRSYYELLRDELDQFLLQYALIDSYQNFASQQLPFPFVEKRELKPRARIPDMEYESQNAFLVVFDEDYVSDQHKQYIRIFDDNKTREDYRTARGLSGDNDIIEASIVYEYAFFEYKII